MTRWGGSIVFALAAGAPPTASAQFLRLGPFDFDAVGRVRGVYTTNVEGQRKSEATAEREDYFVLVGMDLGSTEDVAPSTTLSLDTGISVEKHFNRPDLDNSSSPFGRLRLNSETRISRYRLNGEFGYERSSESTDKGETFVPAGQPDKTRKVSDTMNYGIGLEWAMDPFAAGVKYSYTQDRYEKDFESGDQNEYKLDYFAEWKPLNNLGLKYSVERTKTELINQEDSSARWLETERIVINFRPQLWKRPRLTYGLGLEKEKTEEGSGNWEPIHNFDLGDSYDLSPTLNLSFNANYTIEQNEEENDIGFTYGAALNHLVSPTARQGLRASREPVNTFGSTTDTDQTTIGYDFTKTDLFIYNLTLSLGVTYQISKPLDGDEPDEHTWNYRFGLDHVRALTRKLDRKLGYQYTREDSNLQDEILDEHRVTLTYEYRF